MMENQKKAIVNPSCRHIRFILCLLNSIIYIYILIYICFFGTAAIVPIKKTKINLLKNLFWLVFLSKWSCYCIFLIGMDGNHYWSHQIWLVIHHQLINIQRKIIKVNSRQYQKILKCVSLTKFFSKLRENVATSDYRAIRKVLLRQFLEVGERKWADERALPS